MDEFIISTRPPVGGKRVRRKKPIVVKKKRSAFKKRAAKQGKIIFDTQKAQRGRLKGKTTKQLTEEIQNNFANEVGRQDGGIMGGFGRQQPIVLNVGGQQQADERVREVRRRMDINSLTNPDQYQPNAFERGFREGMRRQEEENIQEVRQVDRDVEVPDFTPPPPPPQADFDDVDVFDSGFDDLDVSIPERQPEPEVEFAGASGDAAEILSQIGTDIGDSSESDRSFPLGFSAGDLPLNRRGFDDTDADSGLDPTFDDRSRASRLDSLLNQSPSETSQLPPLGGFGDNTPFEAEEERVGRGRRALSGIGDLVSNLGGRVGQLARIASRGRSEGSSGDTTESDIVADAIFYENPYQESDAGSSIGFDTP